MSDGRVRIWTDGACSGNPGPGGWGVLLRFGTNEKELSGGAYETTNNQMELRAAIEGASRFEAACEVDLFTDSQYVKGGITGWIHNWKKNGWRTAAKKPVKNAELWQQLDKEIQRHHISWHWG